MINGMVVAKINQVIILYELSTLKRDTKLMPKLIEIYKQYNIMTVSPRETHFNLIDQHLFTGVLQKKTNGSR